MAERDSRLQRLEVFVKGAGEASEAERCFQEETGVTIRKFCCCKARSEPRSRLDPACPERAGAQAPFVPVPA